jgi:hypothetical protein
MALFRRDKNKLSRDELESHVESLEKEKKSLTTLVQHLKDSVKHRKIISHESRDSCVEREVNALNHYDKKKIDLLIDYSDKIRYISPKYLKASGYSSEEVVGMRYTKFLAGDSERIESFFDESGEQTKKIIILGKPDLKNPDNPPKLFVQATKYPIFSYDGEIEHHEFRIHAFTRVSLKKIGIRKPPKVKKTHVQRKVDDAIAKAHKDVDDMIAAKKSKLDKK